MGRIATIIFLWMIIISVSADTIPDFITVNNNTYELYQKQEWKSLIRAGKSAVKMGYNYYYLHMRLGIAYFEEQKYLFAIDHFNKAMELNSNDPIVLEYLYYCYIEMNRSDDAEKIFEQLPSNIKKRVKPEGPRSVEFLFLETGPILNNNYSLNKDIDLDGPENIYGETVFERNAYYTGLGLTQRWNANIRSYYGYINYRSDRTKQFMFSDTMKFHNDYNYSQNQFYVNTSLHFSEVWTLTAAMHYLHGSFSTYLATYDPDDNTVGLSYGKVKLNNYVASIALEKNIHLITMGVFGTYSKLNDANQLQAGFALTYFPLGNLNLYLDSRLINHLQDSKNRTIFNQIIGGRITNKLWLEGFVTFGELVNYNEKNGYVIYNSPDKITFKWGTKLFFPINNKLMFSFEFHNFMKEGSFLTYKNLTEPEDMQPKPFYEPYTYQNYIFIGELKWKL